MNTPENEIYLIKDKMNEELTQKGLTLLRDLFDDVDKLDEIREKDYHKTQTTFNKFKTLFKIVKNNLEKVDFNEQNTKYMHKAADALTEMYGIVGDINNINKKVCNGIADVYDRNRMKINDLQEKVEMEDVRRQLYEKYQTTLD